MLANTLRRRPLLALGLLTLLLPGCIAVIGSDDWDGHHFENESFMEENGVWFSGFDVDSCTFHGQDDDYSTESISELETRVARLELMLARARAKQAAAGTPASKP